MGKVPSTHHSADPTNSSTTITPFISSSLLMSAVKSEFPSPTVSSLLPGLAWISTISSPSMGRPSLLTECVLSLALLILQDSRLLVFITVLLSFMHILMNHWIQILPMPRKITTINRKNPWQNFISNLVLPMTVANSIPN